MKLLKKRTLRILLITALSILLSGGIFTERGYAQVPPPPPPPNSGNTNGHGLGGNQGAPGAPVGGGLEILLVLGAFYGGKKAIAFLRDNQEGAKS